MKKKTPRKAMTGHSQRHKAPASWLKKGATQRARKAVTKRRKKVGKY